jgi:hypothetical protein
MEVWGLLFVVALSGSQELSGWSKMLPKQLQLADMLSKVGINRQFSLLCRTFPYRNEIEQNVVLEQELEIVPETKLRDGGGGGIVV